MENKHHNSLLATYFNQGRAELRQALETSESPSHAAEILRNHIDSIRDTYLKHQTPNQFHVALPMLELLNMLLPILTTVIAPTRQQRIFISSSVIPQSRASAMGSNDASYSSTFRLILLTVETVAALMLSLLLIILSLGNPLGWVAVMLFLLLLFVRGIMHIPSIINRSIIYIQKQVWGPLGSLIRFVRRGQMVAQSTEAADRSILEHLPLCMINGQVLIAILYNAIDHIDRSVAHISSRRLGSGDTYLSTDKAGPEAIPPIQIRLAEQLQGLIGASLRQDTNDILTWANPTQLIHILEDVGLQVEFYDPDTAKVSSQEIRRKFVVHHDPGEKEYVMLLPAIIQGDRVLLRGSIIGPMRPK